MKRQILPQSVTVQKVFLAFSKRGAIIIEIFKWKSVEKAHIPAIFREKERKNMIYAETEIKLKNGCTAVVRNARPEDAKQTIEYLRTVSGESPFLLREPDEVNFTVEKECAILQNKAESPNEIMLTAYVNGELAGNCSLASQGDKRRMKHRCCVSIALYEKYCNLGLGRILLSTLLELAKQCGYTQAELGVIEGNERAKHVYESLGFKEYGFLPNSLHYSDGTARGEYFMVKEL